LPEHYSKALFRRKQDLRKLNSAKKMEAIIEESEYNSSIEEAKDYIKQTFETFGDFAEYNRHCALFGFDIRTQAPTASEQKEFRKQQKPKGTQEDTDDENKPVEDFLDYGASRLKDVVRTE
jgi:hypothetical protein